MCLTQIDENIIWKMKMENFDIEENETANQIDLLESTFQRQVII